MDTSFASSRLALPAAFPLWSQAKPLGNASEQALGICSCEFCRLSNLLHWADWRVRESYEYAGELTGCEWAWEFLRRNKDYAMDWARAGHSTVVLQKDGQVPRLRLITNEQHMQRWGLVFR